MSTICACIIHKFYHAGGGDILRLKFGLGVGLGGQAASVDSIHLPDAQNTEHAPLRMWKQATVNVFTVRRLLCSSVVLFVVSGGCKIK